MAHWSCPVLQMWLLRPHMGWFAWDVAVRTSRFVSVGHRKRWYRWLSPRSSFGGSIVRASRRIGAGRAKKSWYTTMPIGTSTP
eukprot:scaffold138370_cov121-Phaeocystis_antarctica.AAC.1